MGGATFSDGWSDTHPFLENYVVNRGKMLTIMSVYSILYTLNVAENKICTPFGLHQIPGSTTDEEG